MSSKLSWHIIGDPSPAFDDLRRSGAKVVKVFEYESPETLKALKQIVPLVIYRKYVEQSFDRISPDEFVTALPAKLFGMGLVWEGVNEPVISTAEQATALSNWYIRLANLMHARGERVAAYSFSTGNPPLALVPFLADGARACDWLALHEYVKPNSDFSQVGRYKQFLTALPPNARRQVLITETGADSGGCEDCGWLGSNWRISPEGYLAILSHVDQLYAGDDSLAGATIFQFGGGKPWQNFSINGISKPLAQFIAASGGGILPKAPTPAPQLVPAPIPAPQPVPTPSPAFATGIDVSHWQGVMEWTKAKQAGVSFAFIKASDGGSAVDSQFANNWKGAKAMGILRGAYHFFRNGADPLAQANLFVRTLGSDVGELPPVMDFEDADSAPDLPAARIFLDRVQQLTGRKPIIYTGAWYWNAKRFDNVAWAKDFDLWAAAYQMNAPILPLDWQKWTFWQYSGTGLGPTYGALAGDIDLDRFNGTLDDLRAYSMTVTGGAPAPTPMPAGTLKVTWQADGIQELYLNGVGIVGAGSTTKTITGDTELTFRVVARK